MAHTGVMRRFAPLALLAAVALTGCGPEKAPPPAAPISLAPDPVPAAPAAGTPLSKQQCDMIDAQMAANKRLAADGYADDYSDVYAKLLKAGGC